MKLKHFSIDGIQYCQLYMQSPVGLEHNISSFSTFWTHGRLADGSKCGGDIYIGENGCYYCEKCGAIGPIANWAYGTPCVTDDKSINEQYIKVLSGNAIAQALALSSKITSSKNGIYFLNKILLALDTQEFCSKEGEFIGLTLVPREEITEDHQQKKETPSVEPLRHFNKEGVEYRQLHIQSPVCTEHRIPAKPTFWIHCKSADGKECGGDIFIGDTGCYHCERCGATDQVANWTYNTTGIIYGQNDKDIYAGVTNPLWILSLLSTDGITEKLWLNRLIDALSNQVFDSSKTYSRDRTIRPKTGIEGKS